MKALDRALEFNRRWAWVLHLDVRQYFYRIDHYQLECLLANRFKDPALLTMWNRLIESHHTTPGKGLPIGCLTSQHFANFYLGVLDRFVKEELRAKGYVRYMDDLVLWSNDRTELETWAQRCSLKALTDLGLELKAPIIRRTLRGYDFLGARVFDDHWELNRRSRRRFRRKLLILDAGYRLGWLSEQECQERAESLFAFARSGRTKSWHFRRRVLEEFAVND